METTKEKTCGNCRFYLQHYIKTPHGFATTNNGHCVCNNFSKKRCNKYTLKNDCEYWQPAEIQKTERKKNLIDNLKYLTKQLNAVCEVLIDDNN